MSAKKKKVRVEFRRNRSKPPRENDVTRQFQDNADQAGDLVQGERVRAKGAMSRHRTIVLPGDAAKEDAALTTAREQLPGRVLKAQGLLCQVELDEGRVLRCAIRRVLKSLATDERNAVTTGDRVWVRPAVDLDALPSSTGPAPDVEGMIERVEPRRGVLTRASRRREHILVANVDQVVIVVSLVEPDLKPHLIDRYLAAADQGDLQPILCLNKVDLADPVELQPLVGAYSQLGIPTLLTSTKTGQGIPRLRDLLKGRASVFSGQSGVGKSSLLNSIEPDLGLRVREVSDVNQKGRHTTTTAELIRLSIGGWVVDTPGVRQLQLWDAQPEEVEGFFREFRAYVPLCRFPDCTHVHEKGCAILRAVQRHEISERRYVSYLGLYQGQQE